jgi:peptidoglycan-associated lipoprotein
MQSSKGEWKVRAKLVGALVLVLLATQLVGCGWYLRPQCKPCGPYYGNGAYGAGAGGDAYGRGPGGTNGWGANGANGEGVDGANKPRFEGEAKYMLDTVYFDFDQSNIRADQSVALERNLAWMKQNPKAPIRIEGHCDERGTEEYNFALGDRRADAVRQWMIDHGVDPSRMQSVSKGELEPADSGHEESAWSKNRRAEFLVLE